MDGANDKIMSLFKINTTKYYSEPICVNNEYGWGSKKNHEN